MYRCNKRYAWLEFCLEIKHTETPVARGPFSHQVYIADDACKCLHSSAGNSDSGGRVIETLLASLDTTYYAAQPSH